MAQVEDCVLIGLFVCEIFIDIGTNKDWTIKDLEIY